MMTMDMLCVCRCVYVGVAMTCDQPKWCDLFTAGRDVTRFVLLTLFRQALLFNNTFTQFYGVRPLLCIIVILSLLLLFRSNRFTNAVHNTAHPKTWLHANMCLLHHSLYYFLANISQITLLYTMLVLNYVTRLFCCTIFSTGP